MRNPNAHMTAPGNRCEREGPSGPTEPPLPRKCPSPSGGPEGFTLLEVLLSMALTSLGIFCLAGLLKVIGNLEAEDTWETKALFCAQERLEELKFNAATGHASKTEGKEVLTEGSYQGMQREWTFGASSIFGGLWEIRVECSYPWKGTRNSVALSTLVLPEG